MGVFIIYVIVIFLLVFIAGSGYRYFQKEIKSISVKANHETNELKSEIGKHKQENQKLINQLEQTKNETENKIGALKIRNQAFQQKITALQNSANHYESQIFDLNNEIEQQNKLIEKSENAVSEYKEKLANQTFFSKRGGVKQKIINVLSDAEKSIKIAVAWFTHQDLYNKVLDAANNGVNVDIVIINDFINNKSYGLDLNKLAQHDNINFYFGDEEHLMHHKFCIVDEKVVLNGSYNWTYYAEYLNYENYQIIEDNQYMVSVFLEEFEQISKDLQESVTPLQSIEATKDYFSIKNYLSEDCRFQAEIVKHKSPDKAKMLSKNSVKLNSNNQKAVSLLTKISEEIEDKKVKSTKAKEDIRRIVTVNEVKAPIPNKNVQQLPASSVIISSVKNHTQVKNPNFQINSHDRNNKSNSIDKSLKIILLLDISGSMKDAYSNGQIQDVFKRTLVLSEQLSNNPIDVWFFSNETEFAGTVSKNQYIDFIQKSIDSPAIVNMKFKGTSLISAIEKITSKGYHNTYNTYIVCLTDGAFHEPEKTQKLINSVLSQSVFFEIIGIGDFNSSTLQTIKDSQNNSAIQNLNFCAFENLDKNFLDRELNSVILHQFNNWLTKARKIRISKS